MSISPDDAYVSHKDGSRDLEFLPLSQCLPNSVRFPEALGVAPNDFQLFVLYGSESTFVESTQRFRWLNLPICLQYASREYQFSTY